MLRLSTFPLDVRAAGPYYAQSSVPSSPGTGSVWWNTNDGKTYVYTGSAWAESATSGTSVSPFLVSESHTWTAGQRSAIVTLTDAASIVSNFNDGNNFVVTLGGNRTLANPTNVTAGQAGQLVIAQDGTGSRTLAYGSVWKFRSGTAPTLTTAASAVDIFSYFAWDATHIAVSTGLNFF